MDLYTLGYEGLNVAAFIACLPEARVVLRLPVEELGTSRRPSGLATAQVACARRASQSRMTAQVGLFCALLLNSSERQRGLTSICPGVELARK
jgi:hypothetical protein